MGSSASRPCMKEKMNRDKQKQIVTLGVGAMR